MIEPVEKPYALSPKTATSDARKREKNIEDATR
jgi:hypothetical protein